MQHDTTTTTQVRNLSRFGDQINVKAVFEHVVTRLKERRDICVCPSPCLFFYVVIDDTPLHSRSWFKPWRRRIYAWKGCRRYVRGHSFILHECEQKTTDLLTDWITQ